MTRKIKWTIEEIFMLKKHYGKLTVMELHTLIPNRSLRAIETKASELKITRPKTIKYKIKYTSEFYYYLGWLASDGSLSKEKYQYICKISIDPIDKDILLGLKNHLKIGNISYYKNESVYRICNKKFYFHMIDFGIVPVKTKIIKFPPIPKKYLRDFVRGFFDGDGSIFWEKSHKAWKSSFSCASIGFVRSLRNVIQQFAKVTGGSLCRDYRTTHSWDLKYAKFDTITLGKWMYYPGCLSLRRKEDRFKSAFSTANK